MVSLTIKWIKHLTTLIMAYHVSAIRTWFHGLLLRIRWISKNSTEMRKDRIFLSAISYPRIANDPVLNAILFTPTRDAHNMVMMCWVTAEFHTRKTSFSFTIFHTSSNFLGYNELSNKRRRTLWMLILSLLLRLFLQEHLRMQVTTDKHW